MDLTMEEPVERNNTMTSGAAMEGENVVVNDPLTAAAAAVAETPPSQAAAANNQNDEAAVTTKSVAERHRQTLAQDETRKVMLMRYLMCGVLMGVAMAVTAAVYVLAHNKEDNQFETAFAADSNRLMTSFSEALGRQLGALDALSVSVTAHVAASPNLEFPLVNLPFFEHAGAITRVLAGGMWVMWLPLVTDDNREEWEAFTQLHQPQNLSNSVLFEEELRQQQDVQFGLESIPQAPLPEFNTTLEDAPFRGYIYNRNTGGQPEEPNTGPYLPIWQVSPSTPQPGRLNQNMLTHMVSSAVLKQVMNTNKATLGMLNSGERFALTLNHFLTASQYRHEKELFVIGDPLSALAYPVLDLETGAFVGAFLSNFYWRLYLSDVLPPNAIGLICVLENSREQMVSYRVDGPDAVFLGEGDMHDRNFDQYQQSLLVTASGTPVTRGYTTADLNTDFISYTLHIYPSDDTKATYETSQPAVFAVVVALVFLFTSVIFVVYNKLVENRQAVVVEKAMQNSADVGDTTKLT